MQEHYMGYIIVVVAASDPDILFKWTPTCTIRAAGSKERLKEFKWDIHYPTSEQAELVGLLVSKKSR